jgi:hypothetical protein
MLLCLHALLPRYTSLRFHIDLCFLPFNYDFFMLAEYDYSRESTVLYSLPGAGLAL